MKTFILVTFFFIINCSSAQRATISNGRSSVTIDKSFGIELSDSFFKTTEIVVKLIDEDGKTIPCLESLIIIQPKKGDAFVFKLTNKKSVFYLTTKDIPILSHISSGHRIIFSFEPFNKMKYTKIRYGYAISIR